MTLAKDDRPSDAKARRPELARPATGSAEQRQLANATGDLRKNLIALQRLAGNHAVTGLLAGFPPTVLRLALYDGPPLAPGNYKYGDVILGLDPNAMRKVLTDRAGSAGLVAERKWKADFVADMQATPTAQVHKYEDPGAKQTISVEPTLATNADRGQREIEDSASAAQRQFQQDLLSLVGSMLDASEGKLQAEAKRYGFPDHDSIFNPQPPSAGQAAVAGSLPASEEIRGAIRAAKVLLDGKKKLRSVREANAKLGPFIGEMVKPATLEPATKEYYDLRQKTLAEFPILGSFERNEEKLTEFAAGAQFAQPGSTGHGATTAILNAQDKIRFDLADKLSNISVVRAGMKEQDKIDKFWANPTLISSTKRKMALDPKGLPNAAVDDKIRDMTEDRDFSAKIKAAVGIGLLILSVVPGGGLVAGGIGLVMGAVDVYSAFQDFYWEQAAAGTAMDKAEAISQSDPSLFTLGAAIAFGMLEGVAEVKALEGAIGVFKAVRGYYREARAAAAVSQASSGAAKTGAAAELLTAREKLRVQADEASGKPGLGAKVLSSMEADAASMAADLKKGLGQLSDPALKELVIKDGAKLVSDHTTLADEAAIDPARLQADYSAWQQVERNGPADQKGKPFTEWLRQRKTGRQPGILTEPAGLMEYGLDAGEANRSFESALREDMTREVGVWRDAATGEHVCVQGGHSYVEGSWMDHPDNMLNGQRRPWILVKHYHPNRGLIIDRIPSTADFAHVVTNHLAGSTPRTPIQSTVVWTDPASKIRFETQFGYTPGARRPYWTRYRVEDGTSRVASFAEPPWGAGEAEYRGWAATNFADPAAAVPGGNIQPIAQLPPVPGGSSNNLAPPPRPTR
jgi:hypothetical protein